MFKIHLEIEGLNPYDQDLLLTKFQLLKDKLFNNICIDFSMLKSYPNYIVLDAEFKKEDMNDALELYKILNKIEFKKTEYERCICNPIFNLSLNNSNADYGE